MGDSAAKPESATRDASAPEYKFQRPLKRRVGAQIAESVRFSLMALAFVSVTALLGRFLLRGLLSLFLGLFIGLAAVR